MNFFVSLFFTFSSVVELKNTCFFTVCSESLVQLYRVCVYYDNWIRLTEHIVSQKYRERNKTRVSL